MLLLAIWNLLLFSDLFWWLVGGGSAVAALTLFVILVAIIAAMAKKKVDKVESEFEQMGAIVSERIHWPELGQVCFAAGRLNLFAIRASVIKAWNQYGGEKIWILVTKITLKNIPAILHQTDHADGQAQRLAVATAIAAELPGLMAAKDTTVLFGDAIETEIFGDKLDAESKANLVLLSQSLKDWGLEDGGGIVFALATDQMPTVKVLADSIAADLRTEEGRVARVKKVLRKLVPHLQEDPDNRAWLAALVAGNAPPAA